MVVAVHQTTTTLTGAGSRVYTATAEARYNWSLGDDPPRSMALYKVDAATDKLRFVSTRAIGNRLHGWPYSRSCHSLDSNDWGFSS